MEQRQGRGNRFEEDTTGFLTQFPIPNPSPLFASQYKRRKARYSLPQPPMQVGLKWSHSLGHRNPLGAGIKDCTSGNTFVSL